MFLLGAVGNDSTYIRQLKAIMRSVRNNISLQTLRRGIANSDLLTTSQKSLAEQRLNFAAEYINDNELLKEYLKPGRLIIVDLRDELIAKEEALGLFALMDCINKSISMLL
jgi:ethanolamine utilization cobalamin adenosyltransferase